MNDPVNETLLAVLLGPLVAGLGGLLVPSLIASVPEPAPKEAEPEHDPEHAPEEDQPLADPVAQEPPKMLYADIAGRPGLRWRSALASAAAGGLIGASTGLDWSLVWLLPLTPVAVALSGPSDAADQGAHRGAGDRHDPVALRLDFLDHADMRQSLGATGSQRQRHRRPEWRGGPVRRGGRRRGRMCFHGRHSITKCRRCRWQAASTASEGGGGWLV